MTAAAVAIETEKVVLLPVEDCHKSPSQPRRRGDTKPDDDMVASIREKGVISPIITRLRKAGGWEIVYGHRRHAGSVLAKRDKIPAIVRELGDDEVFELQLIENVHRQDMHPLDEADAFRRMQEKNKRSAQEIADKIGRPLSYVVQRLKLAELGAAARAKLEADKMSLGVALLVARVPAPLQAEATRMLWDGVDVARARHQLEERFLLRLDHAPFDITDAKLVEKAGACVGCPKRTGAQRELFPEATKADMCVDPICYRWKLDAVWQIRKKDAAAGGTAVLEGAAAKKALDWNGGFKKLDDEEWVGSQQRKIRTILGKNLPPVTLVRDEKSGAIHEIVKKADVDKAVRRARPKSPAHSGSSSGRDRQEVAGKLREAAVEVAIAEAMVTPLGKIDVLRFVVRALADVAYEDEKIAKRRGLKGKNSDLGVYLKTIKKPVDVASIGFEIALWSFAPSRWQKGDALWGEAMKAAGVNFDAIIKRLAAEAKAKKKAIKTAKPAAKKRAA